MNKRVELRFQKRKLKILRPFKRYIQAIKQCFTGNQSILSEDLVKVLEEAQKAFEDDQKKVKYEAVE